ncbi:hypothetical protein EN780_03500 [Mesorhizobium sp. M4B.F.Ca.ET.089.01.1.1]|nr:hypothetical protein EN780_03500 [Mesorhizobium sp. M4B.F.Ca.ET.089.01.1.1]
MTLFKSKRGRLLTAAVLTSICLTGCATDRFRLNQAYADRAKAEASKTALAEAEKRVQEARRMPVYPERCKRTHHSGVVLGDRLDVANEKGDIALGAANDQTIWCAAWYAKNYDAREPKP